MKFKHLLALLGCIAASSVLRSGTPGYELEGNVVQTIHETEIKSTFRVRLVEDGSFNIRIETATGKTGSIVTYELGSEGDDLFLVRSTDTTALPKEQGGKIISRGKAFPGIVLPADPDNYAVPQILWLAFVAPWYNERHRLTGPDFLPTSLFQNETWLDVKDVRSEITAHGRAMSLPVEIRYFTAGYVVIRRDQIRPGESPESLKLSPGPFRNTFKSPLLPPFDATGKYIAKFLVQDTQEHLGKIIPHRFSFFRFLEAEGAKTLEDVRIANAFEGTVTRFSSWQAGERGTLPFLAEGALLIDSRMKSASGGNAAYSSSKGQWLLRRDPQFSTFATRFATPPPKKQGPDLQRTLIFAAILAAIFASGAVIRRLKAKEMAV